MKICSGGGALITYNIFRFGFFAVFVGLHIALMIGLFRERLWEKQHRGRKTAGPAPKVSVIIPVHNEAGGIKGLLESLSLQDYPAAEYIFIDDRSDDGSSEILKSFAEGRQDSRIITLKDNPGWNKKQYALARGIQAAGGDFFLFTDADCEVSPSWISDMTARLQDRLTGLVIGPVFRKPQGIDFFHLYQCFDHAVRYMYLTASCGLGAAGGGFGNNLIIRREALEQAGGYEAVPSSPTEDAALIAKIRCLKTWKIHAALGKDTCIFTGGESSWAALLNQTLRWNNGGLFGPDLVTRFNFGFLVITISMGILAIPLLPFLPSLWPLSAAVMVSMSMNSAATLGLFGSSLPSAGLRYIFQTIFTPCYFTMLTILGFSGKKVNWKGSPVKYKAGAHQ
ncbi:MAG: glycosyltransferase [Treponema sp.]|jgi:cellulose synthase/poly-beta-1,6-N-acetylglucosamine synthase-like glycosyltransferase|nr:glycosyltransferase [Treponema sp.]